MGIPFTLITFWAIWSWTIEGNWDPGPDRDDDLDNNDYNDDGDDDYDDDDDDDDDDGDDDDDDDVGGNLIMVGFVNGKFPPNINPHKWWLSRNRLMLMTMKIILQSSRNENKYQTYELWLVRK